ncbi:DUF6884 domain-containing protein [Vibrio splendidus]|jgi:cytoplasmic iron level regulating protein YaaA (DUF328/UPF0246 family)
MLIYVVGCSANKVKYSCKAIDMYKSQRFQSSIAKALSKPGQCFILSGLYGLLSLNDNIEPYDMDLNTKPQLYKKDLVLRIASQLNSKIDISTVSELRTDTVGIYLHALQEALILSGFSGKIEVIT